MREIPLQNGLHALVDDDVYEWASRLRWRVVTNRGNLYAVRGHRSTYLAREIMGSPRAIIDHINGNTLDNRRANLRACSTAQNSYNQKKIPRTSSHFKGVTWDKGIKKWRAMIRFQKRLSHLGSFASEIEAARAYDRAALGCFGQFARTNVGMGLLDEVRA